MADPQRTGRDGAGRDRRAVLLGASAVFVAGVSPAWAQSTAVPRFAAIKVDTRPLASIGGGASATAVQRILPAKMQSVFADVIGPGGRRSVLVARIDRLYLASFVDNTPPGFSFGNMDTMDGAGVVVGQGDTPLHVTLSPSYSGAYYLPDIDLRRIDSICYQFAYWLRREMNL